MVEIGDANHLGHLGLLFRRFLGLVGHGAILAFLLLLLQKFFILPLLHCDRLGSCGFLRRLLCLAKSL